MNRWMRKIASLCLFVFAVTLVILIVFDSKRKPDIDYRLAETEDLKPVSHRTSDEELREKSRDQLQRKTLARDVNAKPSIEKADFTQFLSSKPFKTQEHQLRWIKLRIQRLAPLWEDARQSIYSSRPEIFTSPKQILLFPGLLSEYSAYDFATNAFKGGYLGELVQWSDLIAAVHALGHHVTLIVQKTLIVKDVLKKGQDFDVVYTDYIGLHAFRDLWLFPKFKCKLRIVDSFGTEPLYNLRTEMLKPDTWEMFSNWMFEDTRQFMTFYPHTPDNSFLGYVVEKSTLTGSSNRRKNQGVVYGKEGYFYNGKERYLNAIADVAELHATVKDKLPGSLSRIQNHGILKFEDLQRLLQESKLFVGMGFPYDGPAPLEALANGCAFLQPGFDPPHGPQTVGFFKGKPTSRSLTSQHPYLEDFVGEPHVYTIDMHNKQQVQQVVSKIMAGPGLEPYIPYEFTPEGFVERLGYYIQKQNFCDGYNIALHKSASASSVLGGHKASEPIDGKLEYSSCFWSQKKLSSWWQLDLGREELLRKLRITNMFDWYLVKSWVETFLSPFQVQLLSTDKRIKQSRKYTEQRLLYIWDDIRETAQYIRLESLGYKEVHYFVICAMDVYTEESRKPVWPELSKLIVEVSDGDETCTVACHRKDLVCERSYFNHLNTFESLASHFPCKKNKTVPGRVNNLLPAYSSSEKACLINSDRFLFSCAGRSSDMARLCPCREYHKGQVALPRLYNG